MIFDDEELTLPEIEVTPEDEDRPLAATERAIQFFQNKGLSREDAAAFVWNLTKESGKGLQTDLVHDQGTGYGIAGFRDPVPGLGRRSSLFKFTGTKSPNLDQQLEYMWHELNSSEKAALNKVLASQTPEAKAQAAISYFRPRADIAADRANRAKEVLAYLSGDNQLQAQPEGLQEIQRLPTAPTARITVGKQPDSIPQDAAIDYGEVQQPDLAEELRALSYPTTPTQWPAVPGEQVELLPGFPVPRQEYERAQALTRQMQEPVRQGVRGLLSQGAMMYDIPAMLAAVPAAGARIAGTELPAVDSAVQELLSLGQRARTGAQEITGAKEKPSNVIEEAANVIGRYANPGGLFGMTATQATAGLVGADLLSSQLVGPAYAASKLTPEQKARIASGRTKEEKAALRKQIAEERKAEAAAKIAAINSDEARTVVQSIGGAAKIKDSELYALGGMAALTIGAMFAPSIYRRFASGEVPKFRPVKDAVPGTMAISTAKDYARTQDNWYKGVMNVMERAGVPPQTVQKLEKVFGFQTRTAAHGLIDTAIKFGKAETEAFRYQAKVPLAELQKHDSPELRRYLWLRHSEDELLRRAAVQTKAQAQAGPPNINGQTLSTLAQERRLLEQANPQLIQHSQAWRDLNKALWDFESKGEFAIIPKHQMAKYAQTHRNFVPYVKNVNALEQNPFEAMQKHMHGRMLARMENEAKAMLADELVKAQPSLLRTVTPKQLKDNPEWAQNVLTTYRRGVPTKQTGDPFMVDILKTDPYFATGAGADAAYLMKRAFERTTTGDLNPFFALRSFMRSWGQAKQTTPYDRKSPTLLGMTAAVPKQILPQLAKYLDGNLREGWMGQVFPQNVTNAMAHRMAHVYERSLFAQLERAGEFRGSPWLYTPSQARSTVAKLIEGGGPHSTLYQGYLNVLDSIHNAASFNFAARNVGKASPRTLVYEARELTGNPRTRGQYYTDTGKPVRFETEGLGRVERGKLGLAKAYGASMEWAHERLPWTNIIQQSLRRTGQMYLQDPMRFTGRAWLYVGVPSAASYMAATALGDDPNGRSYADYMINGRSDYERVASLYIPMPGRPVEQGLRVSRFQELAPIGPLFETALDHLMRSIRFRGAENSGTVFNNITRAPYFTEKQDLSGILAGFMDLTLSPPASPESNLVLGSQGLTGLYGMFGNTYKPRQDAFDDTPGVSKSVELMARALMPSIADFVGAGASAFMQSEDGVVPAAGQALQAVRKRMAARTEFVRDLAIEQPLSGQSRIMSEYYKRKKEVDQLIRFARSSDEVGVDPRSGLRPGVSRGGQEVVKNVLGYELPRELPGITPSEPTNPLYKQFIDRVQKRFGTDTLFNQRTGERPGGMGFKALIDQFDVAQKAVQSMQKVNPGNHSTWQRFLDERPTVKEHLLEQKRPDGKPRIDIKNPISVQNYYAQRREDTARALLFAIRSVEEEMSKEAGQPITLEMLHPYKGTLN